MCFFRTGPMDSDYCNLSWYVPMNNDSIPSAWQFTLVHDDAVGFASSYALLIHMFSAFEPRHRCHVPNCDVDDNNSSNETSTFLPHWIDFAIPNNSLTSEMLKVDEAYDSCNMYQPIGEFCHPDSFNMSVVIPCESYVYETFPFTETLTTKGTWVPMFIYFKVT